MYYRDLVAINPNLEKLGFHMPPELDGRFILQKYEAHQTIHQKNSRLEGIGILLTGSFRVYNELENGNLFMIEINDPIAFTGEITLLAGHDITSVTLETITPCRIAVLPVDVFDAWLRSDIVLLRYVSERIAAKLYLTSYTRGERMFYSTKYVLLKYILDASEQERPRNGCITIPKTRQQICEEIGLSVNSINRLLTGFKQEGLLEIRHGKICLDTVNLDAARTALRVFLSENRNGTK